jgi:uncharacterized protein (TIGR03000 family)
MKLQLTGVDRQFLSPPLPPGRTFSYTLRAVWTGRDGRPVEVTRVVQVGAGKAGRIDFLEGAGR